MKRLELNERTKEAPGESVVIQDEVESMVGGIPEFTAAELQNHYEEVFLLVEA